jgi:hypothetical protein
MALEASSEDVVVFGEDMGGSFLERAKEDGVSPTLALPTISGVGPQAVAAHCSHFGW